MTEQEKCFHKSTINLNFFFKRLAARYRCQ